MNLLTKLYQPGAAAAAAHLARAGRQVVVLDRSHFPSNTMSTHWLSADGAHELRGRRRVRERHRFLGAVWRGGRASDVRYAGPDGEERVINANLVLGADGRRSSVAAGVGSFRPYRASRNGRSMVFRYGQDPLVGTRAGETVYQFWKGDSLSFLFPSAPRGTTCSRSSFGWSSR